jgi:hypothetical protein
MRACSRLCCRKSSPRFIPGVVVPAIAPGSLGAGRAWGKGTARATQVIYFFVGVKIELASKNFNSITSYTTGVNAPEGRQKVSGQVGNSSTSCQGASKEIANQITNASQTFQLASSQLESISTFAQQ